MIRLVETLPALADDTLIACRILALWECYGAVPFIRFYSGENGSAAAVLDGQAVALVSEEEREEWAWFLSMQPDIGSILTDPATAAAVAEAWETTPKSYPVMRHTADTIAEETADDASPRELYAFLQPIFPGLAPFDTWYPDVCYRSRHGFFRNAVVRDGDVVSSAMTTAEWTGGALIGGCRDRTDASPSRVGGTVCTRPCRCAEKRRTAGVHLPEKRRRDASVYRTGVFGLRRDRAGRKDIKHDAIRVF